MRSKEQPRKPELFVGIDQSYSGFGLVVLDENGKLVKTKLWSFPPMDSDGERLFKIWVTFSAYFYDILAGYGDFEEVRSVGIEDVHVAMEDYAYGKTFNREKMGELGGIVKAAIFGNDKMVTTVPPRSLKKFLTGKGTAKKEDMVTAVQKLEPSITNHNLADAYGLAYMLYSQK